MGARRNRARWRKLADQFGIEMRRGWKKRVEEARDFAVLPDEPAVWRFPLIRWTTPPDHYRRSHMKNAILAFFTIVFVVTALIAYHRGYADRAAYFIAFAAFLRTYRDPDSASPVQSDADSPIQR